MLHMHSPLQRRISSESKNSENKLFYSNRAEQIQELHIDFDFKGDRRS